MENAQVSNQQTFDAIVVGGGPSGATVATELARAGYSVMLLDRAGRIKPCGGAIPPRLIEDFDIPDSQIVAKVNSARIISPSAREVDMPVEIGYVGMVDRDVFDEYLRNRAAGAGAVRETGVFEKIKYGADGLVTVFYKSGVMGRDDEMKSVRAKAVVGADGARSKVAKQTMPNAERVPCVFAYHEIVRTPANGEAPKYEEDRCDVFYDGRISPDFYGWVFPHGKTASVGTGSAVKGFSLKDAVGALRHTAGLGDVETIRREGAPIPLKPLKKWDDGKNVILAGDAAGVVAPASGEGIYYAMLAGQLSAQAAAEFLRSGNVRALTQARKRFMREHGKVFWILGMMQKFWYTTDKRRERFVSICADKDVQRLTWESYTQKRLVKKSPMAHVKIFLKDMAHLCGLVAPEKH
jgi:geranylgeranyl reductase